MEKKKFYKQVFEIEVLSEVEPLPDGVSLEDIGYEITDGHCSGVVRGGEPVEVSGFDMAKLLMSQGSDPGFFSLDEEGNEVNDD